MKLFFLLKAIEVVNLPLITHDHNVLCRHSWSLYGRGGLGCDRAADNSDPSYVGFLFVCFFWYCLCGCWLSFYCLWEILLTSLRWQVRMESNSEAYPGPCGPSTTRSPGGRIPKVLRGIVKTLQLSPQLLQIPQVPGDEEKPRTSLR